MTTPADQAIFCILCDLIAVTDAETPIEEWQAATQRLRSARRDGWAAFAAALTDAPSLPPLDPSDPNAEYAGRWDKRSQRIVWGDG